MSSGPGVRAEELRGLIAEQRLKLREFLSYEDEYEVKVSSKNFKYMIYNSEIEKVDSSCV